MYLNNAQHCTRRSDYHRWTRHKQLTSKKRLDVVIQRYAFHVLFKTVYGTFYLKTIDRYSNRNLLRRRGEYNVAITRANNSSVHKRIIKYFDIQNITVTQLRLWNGLEEKKAIKSIDLFGTRYENPLSWFRFLFENIIRYFYFVWKQTSQTLIVKQH